MARQVIDTTTNNGSYIGDPAKTAFEKCNTNFTELYGFNLTSGGKVAGELLVGSAGAGNAEARIYAVAEGAVYWDSRSDAGGALPNGNAFYRAGTHTWTDGNGNRRMTFNGSSLSITGNSFLRGPTAAQWYEDRTVSRDWAWYATDAVFRLASGGRGGATADLVTINAAGVVTATQFTPTSSADVKDYIEGYTGDACADLDRLVVCTYKYRPEFNGSGKKFVGIIAENFADILPDAVNEASHYETVEVPATRIVYVEYQVQAGVDENGDPVYVNEMREETEEYSITQKRLVPMGYDMAQLLALNTRSHQQKNRRIKHLEEQLSSVLTRLEAAGI